jgi:uncharacterized repeat protein (TIGR03803 family)
MQGKRLSIRLRAALAIFAATLFVTGTGATAQEKVLHNFNNDGTDGAYPQAGLIVDATGNLYGTTNNGGTYTYGTVFELTPAAGGGYTEKILHNFTNGADGGNPQSGLILDGAGNLYGTTYLSGAYCCGTVFELSPAGGGTWTEKVLYSFGSGNTAYPTSGLIFDGAGNLYGTTLQGGPSQGGSVFELTPAGGGNWTERDLHDFGSLSTGIFPYGGVVFDGAGNLYGTTSTGGTSSGGTVFRLAAGSWTMTVLHNFSGGTDGTAPYAGLVLAGGNLYGTTSGGGSSGGTVFDLTPAGGGNWTYQVVHNFGNGNDGSTPHAGLIADSSGNLYGTTLSGGTSGGGTAFRFNAHGELVLHSFGLPEGYGPVDSLTFDAAGKLYGTAQYGGTHGYGTVFEVTPPTAFVPLSQPCRAVDTRPGSGGGGPIPGGTFQNFAISGEGGCATLPNAAVYSMNVTVVPGPTLGYLTIWPAGQPQPVVSTLNSVDGRVKANAAIVPAGDGGAVSIYVTDTANVIVDVNGYFTPPTSSTLAFYPLPPCRVADTRDPTKPTGLGPPSLTGGLPRAFPILNATTCNIPPTGVAAYSLNFTVVPHGSLGYLTVWPTGQAQPTVSTLNDVLGRVIANAAIVVAGSSGEISAYATSNTDLIIDINGYFAAAGQGGLSLYAVAPCRVIDTRHVGSGQPFMGVLSPPVDVVATQCGVSSLAQAYVFNATVIPVVSLGYLTLWPDGENQPVVSTLNAADGSVSNNMAIVPTNNGSIDAFATNLTQLILDISSYFVP